MNEKGIDVGKQRIKQVNEDMIKRAEKIVVLCEKKLCPDFIANRPDTIFIETSDPFSMSVEDTRIIRDQIEAIVRKLI